MAGRGRGQKTSHNVIQCMGGQLLGHTSSVPSRDARTKHSMVSRSVSTGDLLLEVCWDRVLNNKAKADPLVSPRPSHSSAPPAFISPGPWHCHPPTCPGQGAGSHLDSSLTSHLHRARPPTSHIRPPLPIISISVIASRPPLSPAPRQKHHLTGPPLWRP